MINMNKINTEVSFVVRTTDFCGHDLTEMHNAIPNLVTLIDHKHDAMENFLAAMNYSDGPIVHLEDDIILCDDFYNRVMEAIAQYPDTVIQFFSMRKDDLTKGTRFVPGSTFSMNQCFYLPAGIGPRIAEFWKTSSRQEEAGAPYDLLMADFFKANKMKYLIWVPNLVDHKVCCSRIDSRRSSKRQSLTFKK